MKTVKLGDVTKIRTGKLDANASTEDGMYPFFTCSKETLKIDTFTYDCECVLVAGNGDLNVKYYNGKFDAYQRTYIVESKDSHILSVKYLYFFLERYLIKLRQQAIGGVIKYIKLSNLTEAEIPLYDISVQEKIVEILSLSNGIIEKRKTQLNAINSLIDSVFYNMFGDPTQNERKWPDTKLGEITLDMKYGSSTKAVDENEEGFLPILRIPNVEPANINLSSLKYVDIPEKQKKALLLNKGDLLFVRSNGNPAYIGRCAVFNLDAEYLYASYLIRVRLNTTNINPEFLQYQLSFQSFRRKIAGESRTTAGNYNINTKSLKSIKIICPPLELQNSYLTKIIEIKNKEKMLKKSLLYMQKLYSILLRDSFIGGLSSRIS